MNLLRLILIGALLWLLARAVRLYLEKKNAANSITEKKADADLVKCEKCGTYVASGASHVCRPANMPAVLFFLFACFAGDAQANTGGRYLVEITASHVQAVVEVNGITVEKWAFGARASAGASLNHWLRQGDNTLTFRASPLASGQARLQAKVFFLGTRAGGGLSQVVLLEVADIDKARRGTSVSFTVSAAPALALWRTEAPPQAISPVLAADMVGGLRQEIVSVMAVGGGLEDVRLLTAEHADMQRAFGGAATPQPIAVAPQNHQAKLEVSAPPGASDLSVAAVAGTSLFRVARRDSLPLLAVRRSGQVFAIPALIVGWQNGGWHILRRAS